MSIKIYLPGNDTGAEYLRCNKGHTHAVIYTDDYYLLWLYSLDIQGEDASPYCTEIALNDLTTERIVNYLSDNYCTFNLKKPPTITSDDIPSLTQTLNYYLLTHDDKLFLIKICYLPSNTKSTLSYGHHDDFETVKKIMDNLESKLPGKYCNYSITEMIGIK